MVDRHLYRCPGCGSVTRAHPWRDGHVRCDGCGRAFVAEAHRLRPDRLREVATRVEDGECVSHDGECRREGGLTCRLCLADVLYGIACQVEAERVKRPAVLAADGEPLEAGQTVWKLYPHVERVVVKDIYRAGGTMVVEYQSDGVSYPEHCHPSDLTHTKPEPPDSWQRIEEDARLKPFGYVDRVLGWDMSKSHSQNQARSAMTHDLVRRCRALAERERGE